MALHPLHALRPGLPRPALNADVGESAHAVQDGSQGVLLDHIDLAHVACGGHAGDPRMVRETLLQCRARGVTVGAHPGYPDPAGFGRRSMPLEEGALAEAVAQQLRLLCAQATALDLRVVSVKPHGALYHDLGAAPVRAFALVEAMRPLVPHAAWVFQAGSPTVIALRAAGIPVWGEAFADRRTDASGALLPRSAPDALITDIDEACAVAVALAQRGDVDTVCVHGDTPGAAPLARAVRWALHGGAP